MLLGVLGAGAQHRLGGKSFLRKAGPINLFPGSYTGIVHEDLSPYLTSLRTATRKEPLGLYLHVPFCVDRCTYCSFVSSTDHRQRSSFLRRLEQEIRDWGEALEHPKLDTVYMGGGTPSVLKPEELEKITEAVRSNFDIASLAEMTIEANPGTVSQDWMKAARSLGFDRISLGIQSLDDTILVRLGRIHTSRQALDALEDTACAGFDRISADLMVGVPGEQEEDILGAAMRLVELGVKHLSIYMLDLDKDCVMKREVEAARLALPSEDAVADTFEALQRELPRLGMLPYEISNYASPGQESIHNLRYWQRRPYLGLGPSAASQMANLRWSEGDNIPAWITGHFYRELQILTPEEELAEIPMLGLRMHTGVDWEAFRARARERELLQLVENWERELEPFVTQGLLKKEGNRLRLSSKGMLLSSAVLQVFA